MTSYAILLVLILNANSDIISMDSVYFDEMSQCEQESTRLLQFYNVKTRCILVAE
jgi:hypothetical protein